MSKRKKNADKREGEICANHLSRFREERLTKQRYRHPPSSCDSLSYSSATSPVHFFFFIFLLLYVIIPYVQTAKVTIVSDTPVVSSGGITNGFIQGAIKGCQDHFSSTSTADCEFILLPSTNGALDGLCTDATVEHIVTVGFQFGASVKDAAERFPTQTFSTVDVAASSSSGGAGGNVQGLLFAEDQSGFLAGVTAGLVSSTKIVGVIGGLPITAVRGFVNGFMSGVANSCPRCRVVGQYVPDFANATLGEQAGERVVKQGADVLFAPGGQMGSGAIEYVAKTYSTWVIGVDVDEWASTFYDVNTATQKPHAKYLLTSAMKRVDVAVKLSLTDRYLPSATFGGNKRVGAPVGGVGLAPCHEATACAKLQTLGLYQESSSGPCPVYSQQTVWFIVERFLAKLKQSLVSTLVDSETGDFVATKSNETNVYIPLLVVGNSPGPVSDHTFLKLQSDSSKFYLYGGAIEDGSTQSHVYLFDYDEQLWSLENNATSSSQVPLSRAGHAGFMEGTEMYIWGGINNPGLSLSVMNDMWKYNTIGKTWTQIQQSTNAVVPSARHSMCTAYSASKSNIQGSGKLFVFGGEGGTLNLNNEFWTYTVATNEWDLDTKLSGVLPKMKSCAMVADPNRPSILFLYGGESVTGKQNGFYRIDALQSTISTIISDSGTSPPVLAQHRMAFIDPDSLLILGGSNSTGVSSKGYVYEPSRGIFDDARATVMPQGFHSFALNAFEVSNSSTPCQYSIVPSLSMCQYFNLTSMLLFGGLTSDGRTKKLQMFYPVEETDHATSSDPFYTSITFLASIGAGIILILVIVFIVFYLLRKREFEKQLNDMGWRVYYSDIHLLNEGSYARGITQTISIDGCIVEQSSFASAGSATGSLEEENELLNISEEEVGVNDANNGLQKGDLTDTTLALPNAILTTHRLSRQSFRKSSLSSAYQRKSSVGSLSSARRSKAERKVSGGSTPLKQSFILQGRYHHRTVAVKKMGLSSVELSRKFLRDMKERHELNDPNIAYFIGACVDSPNVCVLYDYYEKGSLLDVLGADQIELGWMFKFSLLTDLCNGLKYVFNSYFQYHAHLRSSNCLIDNRWKLVVVDFGLSSLADIEYANLSDERKQWELLWTAPELLQLGPNNLFERKSSRVTVEEFQSGDIFGFGIILGEVIDRTTPYFSLHEGTNEILHMIKDGSVDFEISDKSDTPGQVADLQAKCISRNPSERPSISKIKRTLVESNPNRKSSILDNMANMLETYASNLEVLVSERTEDLLVEKELTKSLLERTSNLLGRMLPKSISEQLTAGKKVEPESFDSVTIFFSDIVGFTSLARESTPLEIVAMLNSLYTCFDGIIDDFDVYKVETIGDAYMVTSGVPIRNGDTIHAREIASMSLTLLNAIQGFQIPHRPEEILKLRCGIHSGPCVAGVVGSKMPRYCLFGDTVNTASRMESTGVPLKIHLSGSTRDLLGECYEVEERGVIEVKGKGEMRTYFLLGRR
eukprot:Nk52_evm25s355 gene=Nk52_evmTU25s355